jgi:hypothetical protein
MDPLVVDKKVAELTVPPSVKPAMERVGATPEEFGTATKRNHGLSDMPLPFFSIPIEVEPTAMVSPSEPAVVHAGTVAGGGQNPTGSGRSSARACDVQANPKAKATTRLGNSTFFKFHSPSADILKLDGSSAIDCPKGQVGWAPRHFNAPLCSMIYRQATGPKREAWAASGSVG